jgi:hypothetical protein
VIDTLRRRLSSALHRRDNAAAGAAATRPRRPARPRRREGADAQRRIDDAKQRLRATIPPPPED